MAGTLAPITREYDVPLSVIRGFSSVSYAHEIGEQWRARTRRRAAFTTGMLLSMAPPIHLSCRTRTYLVRMLDKPSAAGVFNLIVI